MSDQKNLTTSVGAPVPDNENVLTAGPRGPMLLQDVWFLEKLAHFDREVIPERRMHAKGSGAFGTFTVTGDITRYTKAAMFSGIGKKTDLLVRFSTVAGERGAADAERDIRGFAIKFYTEEGNWDLVGNNTPVFFLRDPLKFPDLNHAIKRDPRTNMRSARNNWDFREDDDDYYSQPRALFRSRGRPCTAIPPAPWATRRTLSSSATSTTACSATPNTGKEWPRPSACSRDNQIWVFRAEVSPEGEASARFLPV